MATLSQEQIEQKKQQLKQFSEEMNAIIKELQEAGAWPLDDDDLGQTAGGGGSDVTREVLMGIFGGPLGPIKR